MTLTFPIAVFAITRGGLETFFLVCFGVGFVMSLISFAAGSLHLHLPGKWHLPHFGSHGHGHLHGDARFEATHISPLNFPSAMAFLAWFGAVGYMTLHHYGWGVAMSVVSSLGGGIAGGWLVYLFLRKMVSYDSSLDPEDFRMEGALGTLEIGIRAGGTGELVYVQGGSRKTCAARSEDGSAMEKGAEVAVSRFEKGIAYVRRWEEFKES